ncbi:MAG TPA: hypothetical protein VH110_05305 [Candidatus Acidoferrum sp.]|jgi:hypothetical protein|nr:hypothetical protein [Candidatus Acidoferrum sp.]
MAKIDLTPKQKRFAYLVANGSTRTEAYAEVYLKTGKQKTATNNGHVATLDTRTSIEIARRESELMPLGTMQQEVEFCLKNLKGLALNSPDQKVRLLATLKLHEICETRIGRERELTQSGSERRQVIADLEGLYRKALEQPIVEAVIDSEPQAEEPAGTEPEK